MTDFSKNLKKLRKRKGFSQARLAKAVHYGHTAIANYENGRCEPSFDTLIRLAAALDATTDELLGISMASHELQLLADYRKLPPKNQQLIAELVRALLHSK